MLAGMVGAISIPDAFGARAWLLVAGYVGIQVVRNLFVVLVTHRQDPLYRPVQRIRLRGAADERGRLGRDLSYLYVLLVAGIIVVAVGNELVIANPSRRLGRAELV